MNTTFSLCTLLSVLALPLAGQDTPKTAAPKTDPAKPDFAAKEALVRKALATMAGLKSLSFATQQTSDSQFLRQAGRGQAKSETGGTLAGGVLAASLTGGTDEVVWSGRRMIAREKDGEWAPRKGTLADGRPLPCVFDPELFFQVLGRVDHEVIHTEVGALADRPVEIVTLHFEADAARDLVHAGLIPDGADFGSTMVFRAMGGGGKIGMPKSDVTVDVALSIDPATRWIHAVKVKSYTKSAVGAGVGAFQLAVGPGGGVVLGGAQAAEEEDENDAKKAEGKKTDGKKGDDGPTFQDGLPVRKHKANEMMVVTYDVTLKDHDKAASVELSAKARELLGLPAAK